MNARVQILISKYATHKDNLSNSRSYTGESINTGEDKHSGMMGNIFKFPDWIIADCLNIDLTIDSESNWIRHYVLDEM